MPELTRSYPNEGAYAQCSYFQTGPPPIALTAVNEIVLPVLTLPRSTTNELPQTTTSRSTTSPTATARPGPSEVGQIPSQTSVSRTADATTSSGPNGGGSAPPPRPSDDGEEVVRPRMQQTTLRLRAMDSPPLPPLQMAHRQSLHLLVTMIKSKTPAQTYQ
jgi:hypothetical protein